MTTPTRLRAAARQPDRQLIAAMLIGFALLFTSLAALATDRDIRSGPEMLSRFLSQHADKIAIVLVSTPGCGFCDRLRREQLRPLLRDPEYNDISIFEIMMRDSRQFEPAVQNFQLHDGRSLNRLGSPADLSKKMNISVAPTLLFLSGARELDERLVGYGNPDFYWAYFSRRIDQSRNRLSQLR